MVHVMIQVSGLFIYASLVPKDYVNISLYFCDLKKGQAKFSFQWKSTEQQQYYQYRLFMWAEKSLCPILDVQSRYSMALHMKESTNF